MPTDPIPAFGPLTGPTAEEVSDYLEMQDADEGEAPVEPSDPTASSLLLEFITEEHNARDTWKRAQELIQSAESKGFTLIRGGVSDDTVT